MKQTVVLRSKDAIGGDWSNCTLELGQNFLQNHKQYLCKLNYFFCRSPSVDFSGKYVELVIEGMSQPTTFHKRGGNPPFTIFENVSAASEPMLFRPSYDESKIVSLNQNILTVKLFDAQTGSLLGTSLAEQGPVDRWIMELEFVDVTP